MSKNTTIEAIVAAAVAQALVEAGVTQPVDEPKAERKTRKAKKGSKAAKASKAPKAEGLPFQELRAILREHKAAGLVESGISVKAMIEAGRMDAFGVLTDAPEAEPKVEAKVAAKIDADEPAKVRKPVGENHASQGPRDAKGRITPKETWETREALAMTGKVGREGIDALVDSGIRVDEAGAFALFA